MTQLLISVKNVEESLIARYANTHIIDLKNPSDGALGALHPEMVSQIIDELNGGAFISATVGEKHSNVAALIADMKHFASLGVNVVKISVSELFLDKHFFVEMQKLTSQGIKVVAVFFADKSIDLALIEKLQASGFYGAMLDTQDKSHALVDVQSMDSLETFVRRCHQCHLISGLAGSVREQHVNALLKLAPDFIGMRGGVCDEENRTQSLSQQKVKQINGMLLNYNKIKAKSADLKASSLQI